MESGEMPRTVAVHQPNYLPWIGYFHKVHRSDVFVLLDDVEYSSGDWINRNRIKTPDGWTWLTVPVGTSNGSIADVEISTGTGWRDDHWKSLKHNYGSAEYFDEWAPFFEDAYDREWTSLYELNRFLLERIAHRLGLEYDLVQSGDLDVDGAKTDRIVEICASVDGERYVSGQGAKEYLEESAFDAAGIELEYQSFEHPTYPQQFGEFVPKLSLVDVLFNVGTEATREVIREL